MGTNDARLATLVTHCSLKEWKRRLVGSPKSEDRPVATTVEEPDGSHQGVRLRMPVSRMDLQTLPALLGAGFG